MLIPAGFIKRLARRLVSLADESANRLGERRMFVLLKRDHSLRVHAFAVRIAKIEAPDLLPLCRAAALMHDIGRFEQFERFGTFRDDVSVDHGNLGAEILKREEFSRNAGRGARADHSGRAAAQQARTTTHLEEPLRTILRVVRDADADIVPVVLTGIGPDAQEGGWRWT